MDRAKYKKMARMRRWLLRRMRWCMANELDFSGLTYMQCAGLIEARYPFNVLCRRVNGRSLALRLIYFKAGKEIPF